MTKTIIPKNLIFIFFILSFYANAIDKITVKFAPVNDLETENAIFVDFDGYYFDNVLEINDNSICTKDKSLDICKIQRAFRDNFSELENKNRAISLISYFDNLISVTILNRNDKKEIFTMTVAFLELQDGKFKFIKSFPVKYNDLQKPIESIHLLTQEKLRRGEKGFITVNNKIHKGKNSDAMIFTKNTEDLSIDRVPSDIVKIHNFFNPNYVNLINNIPSFDYVRATTDKDYLESISGVNNYLSILEKYPISKETEAKYTDMSEWLYQAKLYNEAILLAVNIAKFNPESARAYLVLGDSYLALKETKKAEQYYTEFVKLAQKLKLDIPARVKKYIQ